VKPKDDKKTEQIFRATLKLVKERGLAGITMSEIARAANLATGTLYIYFAGKDELINALFTECRRASAAIYFMNYTPEMPFKIGFKTIWLNLLKHRMENFEEAVFMDQCYHSPFITESTKEITSTLLQPLYKLMERGKKEGLIKKLDTFILLIFMVGGINEIVKHSTYSGIKLSKNLIEEIFNLCWDGLKA
jgi:AcrR family transcriptional regulator